MKNFFVQRVIHLSSAWLLFFLSLSAPLFAEPSDVESTPQSQQQGEPIEPTPFPPTETTPDSQPVSPDETASPTIPESSVPEPHPLTTEQLYSQIDLLIVEDKKQDNVYITTLNSQGNSLSKASPSAIFGTLNPSGSNRLPVIWYPHRGVQDVARLTQAEPAEGFRGLANARGDTVEGAFTSQALPSADYTNLLLSQQALKQILTTQLSSHRFQLKEQLEDGRERQITAEVETKAHIILNSPAKIDCHDEVLEGEEGRICKIREVQVSGDNLNSSDLLFILRSPMGLEHVRYRVAQLWYPLGTPLPVSEFVQSQGVELFIPKLSVQQQSELMSRLSQQEEQNFRLQGGFYSASRYSQGDKFALQLGGKLPSGEERVSLSRLETVIIDDQVKHNHYITTLNSVVQKQPQKPALFGVRHPGTGEKTGTWFSKGINTSLQQPPLPTDHVQPTPTEFFLTDGTHSAFLFDHLLSEVAWQQLNEMSAGESKQLRTEASISGEQQFIFSHLVMGGRIQLSQPDTPECRDDVVEGANGRTCRVRNILLQGTLVGDDLRFVVSSRQANTQSRYRVGEHWNRLGDSLPLSALSQGESLEIFYVPSETRLAGEENPKLLLKFYSASRLGAGDHYTSLIPLTDSATQPTTDMEKEALQLSAIQAEQAEIPAGDTFKVHLKFNRSLLEGESFFLRLTQMTERNQPVLNLENLKLNQQILSANESQWLEVKPVEAASEYVLWLPTQAEARRTDLQLHVRLTPPEPVRPQARSLLTTEVQDSTSTQQVELRVVSLSPRLYTSQLILVNSQDGISGMYPAKVVVKLPADLSPPLGNGTIRLDNAAGTSSLNSGTLQFLTSAGLTPSVPWGLGTPISVPPGASEVHITASQSTGMYDQVTNTIRLSATGSRLVEMPFRLLGAYYNKFAHLRSITAIPSNPAAGEEASFQIETDGVSATSSGEYLLTCDFSNTSILSDTQKYRVFSATGKKLGEGTFKQTFSLNAQSVVDSVYVKVTVASSASLDSSGFLRCKIDHSLNKDSGRFLSSYFYVDTPEPFYMTGMVASSEIDQASLQATLSQAPTTQRTLFYKIEPIGLTAQEMSSLKLTYQNMAAPGNPIVTADKQGSISIHAGEMWKPRFVAQLVDIDKSKEVYFYLSTRNNDFGGIESPYKQSRVGKIQARPNLEIGLPSDTLSVLANESLRFPIEIKNRLPASGESLVFELIKEGNATPLSEILDLSQATLSILNGAKSESLDLSQSGEVIHPLDTLIDKKLLLTIPAKMPAYHFNGQSLSLKVNWINRKGVRGESAQVAQAYIKPFVQRIRIQTAQAGTAAYYSGEIGEDKEVSQDFALIWQRGPTLENGRQSVAEQLQERTMRTLPNQVVMKLNGLPVMATLPGVDKNHYCALNIVGNTQQQQVALPAFVTYVSDNRLQKFNLGCSQGHPLQEPAWSITSGTEYYEGTLNFGFGFNFSDPVSQYTLPQAGTPGVPWQGKAEGIMTLSVEFVLNP